MNEKKGNNLKIIIITILITLVAIVVIGNYGSIEPPNPKIVTHELNSSSSTLFEQSAIVEAVIRNDGGDGDIVYEATIFQNGNSWTKSTKKYFKAKETAKLELQFDEVEFLKGISQAKIKAYSFGK